jgi:DNA invertase Pin-like site-specific DNA recombinase
VLIKAWGYVRVSTDDQLRSTLGVQGYIARIVQYCEQNGLDLGKPCRVNVEGRSFDSRERIVIESESAYKTPFLKRKGVKAILDAREEGDALVIAKVDRAFRNMRDAFVTTGKLKEDRVPLHLVDLAGMNLDLSGAGGELKRVLADMTLALFAFAAEMESAQRSDRLKSANRASRLSRGFNICHTPPPGFKFVGKGDKRKIVPSPQELALMRKVREWRALGYGRFRITEMLKEMNVWVDYRAEWVRRKYGPVPGVKAVEKLLRRCNQVEEIEKRTGLTPEDGKAWLQEYNERYLIEVEERRIARKNRKSERLAAQARRMLAST